MEKTRKIAIGSVTIGGGSPVAIQSMTNTDTSDEQATSTQLGKLESVGCDIARIAFSSAEECALIPRYKRATVMPLVADIQYDYRLAIAAIENGIDKVRFNPGNIGDERGVARLLSCAAQHGTPIRIGVNSGSLPRDLRDSPLTPAERLVEAALRHTAICEKYGYDRLVLSVKSSSAPVTVRAYRMLHERTDYPLHLGVTEAGSYESALVKSAAALGSLLMDGIGDTIRVSVTGDVAEEIRAARLILRACGLDRMYCEIVSCPTCSRTHIDLSGLERAVRARYGELKIPLKLAVMGCAVNGPGEAADADFGIAGGDGKGVIFEKGTVIKIVKEERLLPEFCAIVDRWVEKHR